MIWANTFNRFDPSSPFGGYKESGYGREGGRHGIAAYLKTGPSSLAPPCPPRRRQDRHRTKEGHQVTRLAVPKTYKLYIGGRVPAQRVGPHVRDRQREGCLPRQRREGLPQGCPRRGRRRPRRRRRLVRRHRVQPRPGALPDRRAARGAPRAVRRRDRRRRGRVRAPRRPPRSTTAIDRWVWYAGWADKYAQVAGNANPVSGPYFNISVPEPTGVVAIVAPQDSSLLGLVSAVAPALVAGNTVVVVASEKLPLSAISLSEVLATSDVPKGVVNVLTGLPRRDRAVARQPRRTSTRSTSSAPATSTGSTCRSPRPTRSSGCSRPRTARTRQPRRWTASPRSPRRRPSGTRRA